MPVEHVIGVAGGVFFALCGVMMFYAVRRGRRLCRQLAERLPEAYAAEGRPLPGLWDAPRRQTYYRFVMQRRFAALADARLVEEFERMRRVEMRQMIFMLAGFAAFGLAWVALRFAPD